MQTFDVIRHWCGAVRQVSLCLPRMSRSGGWPVRRLPTSVDGERGGAHEHGANSASPHSSRQHPFHRRRNQRNIRYDLGPIIRARAYEQSPIREFGNGAASTPRPPHKVARVRCSIRHPKCRLLECGAGIACSPGLADHHKRKSQCGPRQRSGALDRLRQPSWGTSARQQPDLARINAGL